MQVIARVKSNNYVCGYIIESNNVRQYVDRNRMGDITATNAIKLANGEWKAKPGYNIKTIKKADLAIEINNRNTYIVGKPKLIYNFTSAKLSRTQKIILEKLVIDKLIIINKKKENIKITMKDLSAMTAYTGIEYSLFEKPDKYIIARGTERGIHLSKKETALLINNRYKWIGHTHPGNTFNCLIPSDGDYDTLRIFNQRHSMIYNSIGMYYIFGEETEL